MEAPTLKGTDACQERLRSQALASAFADACSRQDVDALHEAMEGLALSSDGWHQALALAAQMADVSPIVRAAFAHKWFRSKSLVLSLSDRRVVATALRALLPAKEKAGKLLRLYRGTSGTERRRRQYGFSWSPDVSIARSLAIHSARTDPSGGLILRTVAPTAAILYFREDGERYVDGEIIVDPFRLGHVQVFERLRSQAR